MAKTNKDETGHDSATDHTTVVRRGAYVADELDVAFDLLGVARRRYLLYYLSDRSDGRATIEEAIEGVRDLADGQSGSTNPPPRQTVRLELIHSHLPRLEAKGVVDWDPRHGDVNLQLTKPLEEFLEWARVLEFG